MAKRESKLTKDLERLQQRIQTSRKSLHQTGIKAEGLGASIQAARIATDARKQKWLK
jgi:hypothetical protein